MTTILRASAILTLSEPSLIWDGYLVFDETGILETGLQTGFQAHQYPDAQVINLGNRVLFPGFIQTHIHLCQTLFRGLADDLNLLDWLQNRIFPFENAHTAASMKVSAELGILELLSNGTTTLMDMGSVRHYEAVLEAAERLGIRGFFGKALMDDNPLFPSLSEPADEALASLDAQIGTWHGRDHGRIRMAVTPRFVLSCTPKLMKEAYDRVRQDRSLRYHTHSSEQISELAEVRKRFGLDNVELFHSMGLLGPETLLAHCIWLNDREKDLLKSTQTRILHCPSSNLKLGSGIAGVPALATSGIQVSLGADGAPCNNSLDPFTEMRLAALIQKPVNGPTAMPARQVFRMATSGGAEALGLEQETGQLRPGLKADLVAVSLDSLRLPVSPETEDDLYSALVYSAQRDLVTDVWVNSKAVKRNGELLVADEAEILFSARKELKALKSRL
ncbi:MAG: amidohydrolase family protein [Bacteroidetes bacterium]|nr:amidohydrolase family protein [Bacteroidota bacterium]